eukprot:2663775-Pyramimonas_sp.AAC.1
MPRFFTGTTLPGGRDLRPARRRRTRVTHSIAARAPPAPRRAGGASASRPHRPRSQLLPRHPPCCSGGGWISQKAKLERAHITSRFQQLKASRLNTGSTRVKPPPPHRALERAVPRCKGVQVDIRNQRLERVLLSRS